MMIIIIGYGMGNLGSILNILKKIDLKAKLPLKIGDIEEATKLILPGVGAFNNAIKNCTKIDHYCHIGHNIQIGENFIITANVIIAGSTKIGSNVWIGPQNFILNKITIGNNVYISSHTNVIEPVKDNAVVVGNSAKILRIGNQPHCYP